MGAKQSAFLSDREKLLEATKDTRSVIDAILQYLLDEIKITDLAALSSQTDCKRYVISLAGTLNRLFYEINLAPEQSKDGIIYFRPIKELAEPKTDTEKNNRQSLCIILSYFYVRIFQIFGALALTLMDDASAYTTSGLTQIAQGAILGAPGKVPFYMGGGDEELVDEEVKLVGGAFDSLGVFSFLKPELDREETRYGHLLKNSSRPIYFYRRTGDSTSGKAVLFVTVRGVKNGYIKINISASQRDVFPSNRITVSISDIAIGDSTYSVPSEVTNKSFSIERESPGEPYTLVSDVTMTAGDALIKISEKIVEWVERRMKDKDYDRDYDRYHRKDDWGLRKKDDWLFGKKDDWHTSHGTPIDPLKIDKLIINLRRDKPLAHCIARAVQLLSSQPIENKQTYSYICQGAFLETKSKMYHTGKTRAGLPGLGEGLDTSPGMYALSQLFFDFVRYGMPDVTRREPSIKQFEEFLANMAKLYGDDVVDPKKLSEVKNRRKCGTDAPIAVKSDVANSVYDKVKMLYQIQLKHTSNAGKILSQLFVIVREPVGKRTRIQIHPNIFKKGIKELERINQLTRTLLIDYYRSCETVYQMGADIIKKSIEVKPEDKLKDGRLAAPGVVAKPAVAGIPAKPTVPGIAAKPAPGLGTKPTLLPGVKPIKP